MFEWHISPEEITNSWSRERLNLLVEKMAERHERQNEAYGNSRHKDDELVSDAELFAKMGVKVQKAG